MTITKLFAVLALGISVHVVGAPMVQAQSPETIFDTPGVVRSAEKMSYPPIARQARVEGDVVVKVTLDSAGNIASAIGLSGAKLLIDDSVANAKKWQFAPGSSSTVIIVYEFRISKRECNTTTKSRFRFKEPNIAVVTGCAEHWQP